MQRIVALFAETLRYALQRHALQPSTMSVRRILCGGQIKKLLLKNFTATSLSMSQSLGPIKQPHVKYFC